MFSCFCIFQSPGNWCITIHGCTELEKTVLEQWHVFFPTMHTPLRYAKQAVGELHELGKVLLSTLSFSSFPFPLVLLHSWTVTRDQFKILSKFHPKAPITDYKGFKLIPKLAFTPEISRKDWMISQWNSSVLNCCFKDCFLNKMFMGAYKSNTFSGLRQGHLQTRLYKPF